LRKKKRGGAAAQPDKKDPKKSLKPADASSKDKPPTAKMSEVKKSHESAEIAKALAPVVAENKSEITIDANRGESSLDDR